MTPARSTELAIVAVVAALAFAVAGCGTPNGTATPTTPTTAPRTLTRTLPAPTATPPGPLASLVLPSFELHTAPALEATLPNAIDGQTLRKSSFTLAQLNAIGQGSDLIDRAFVDWTGSLGRSGSDVLVATAVSDASPTITVDAIQVRGADPAQVLPAFERSLAGESLAATPATVGGKQVVAVTGPSQVGYTTYAYAKGDTLYVATAADAETTASVVQALP